MLIIVILVFNHPPIVILVLNTEKMPHHVLVSTDTMKKMKNVKNVIGDVQHVLLPFVKLVMIQTDSFLKIVNVQNTDGMKSYKKNVMNAI